MSDAPNAYRMEQAMSAWMSARARILNEDPDLQHDESVLSELMAAETEDVHDIMRRLTRASIEADIQATAVDARITELEGRRDRWRRRQQSAKSALMAALEALGYPAIREPDFTVAKKNGRASVVITDEKALPDEFVKTERIPKKADIADALKGGKTVPGAVLGNPMPYLEIRRT